MPRATSISWLPHNRISRQNLSCQERGGGNHQNAKQRLVSLIAEAANRSTLFLSPATFHWLDRLDRLSPLVYRAESCFDNGLCTAKIAHIEITEAEYWVYL